MLRAAGVSCPSRTTRRARTAAFTAWCCNENPTAAKEHKVHKERGEAGRDAFHRVPEMHTEEKWDAVERVLTEREWDAVEGVLTEREWDAVERVPTGGLQ